ncbi:helix-turn-helix domain-containing protein [Shewanella fidelis]|uniref:helix-turn-helix domain-containing protein n=1 Tax=Shewanella fidelis TaxID=173509 RepID=UPI000490B9D3|nr:helix-turn-helix transcriptional regulator [Shewanella fidelis]
MRPRPTQEEILTVLITATNNYSPKIKKTDLAERIGVSFPTLTKLYSNNAELTLNTFWAWCDVVRIEPEDVYFKARTDKMLNHDPADLLVGEILQRLPPELKSSARQLLIDIAKAFNQQP